MILQALYDYYQRKAADPESGIAPEGFEWKEIPFVIVIDRDGNFVSLEDTREGEGKKKKAKSYLLPKSVVRTGLNGWKNSFLFWDHYGYVLGHARSEHEKDQVMAEKQMSSFIEKLHSLPVDVKVDEGVLAVMRFYENGEYEKVKESDNWRECSKIVGCNMSFRLDGEVDLIPCRDAVRIYVESQIGESADDVAGLCLVTGKNAPIARIHSDTPINKDSKKFVSFQKNSGYDSYGKEQAFNAPISKSAEFAYTTALNMLLGKESKNKVQVGDATTVFWSQKQETFEEDFPVFFGYRKDDPDADVRAVKALYEGVYAGHAGMDSDTRFYVLGLAPNSARISVRFWHTGTIAEFAGNIRQHFDDLDIIRRQKDSGHFSMFWLLSAMGHEGKVDNVPPNLSGQIFQSVITGGLYPATMLQQAIRRIRATQDVTRVQASILKAYLNRFSRIYKTKEKEINVALDPTNNNPGYRLGRLFAVLEKIQEEASPGGLNATIRDRFYGAASSTPVTVFPQLLKLKNHHLSKLDNAGRRVNFERMLASVFEGIGNEMPSHLSMEDQARFAIGYYHQRQDFFKKKDSDNNNETKGESL
ncbi:type I-C CRISPR-associated protein Cas8c/Csd1 [Chlorobaculum sp. MV4-Y]|uniref:type I-C CRISPR-associated protein Cas8c/Csd1 n=1 Tax=Chlorobaculum sp. MV4-Y TaxID=2976335 RepID=UPI003983AD90